MGDVDRSSETSISLLRRAKDGDVPALDRLCARYLPALTRWASGRLPGWARDVLDTGDLVQDAVLKTLTRLEGFEFRHDFALHAYLRQAVLNRIQDEVRRIRRRPRRDEMPEQQEHPGPSPLEEAVGSETLARYEAALARLGTDDREAIIGRVEMKLSYAELAEALGRPSPEAMHMAVSRALLRLAKEMGRD